MTTAERWCPEWQPGDRVIVRGNPVGITLQTKGGTVLGEEDPGSGYYLVRLDDDAYEWYTEEPLSIIREAGDNLVKMSKLDQIRDRLKGRRAEIDAEVELAKEGTIDYMLAENRPDVYEVVPMGEIVSAAIEQMSAGVEGWARNEVARVLQEHFVLEAYPLVKVDDTLKKTSRLKFKDAERLQNLEEKVRNLIEVLEWADRQPRNGDSIEWGVNLWRRFRRDPDLVTTMAEVSSTVSAALCELDVALNGEYVK